MPESRPHARQHWYIANRRKHVRLEKQVPVIVAGFSDDGNPSNRATTTFDVSTKGICLLWDTQIEIGEKVVISANEPELKAHMAVFEVRWTRAHDDRYLIGAELDIPSYKWQVAI